MDYIQSMSEALDELSNHYDQTKFDQWYERLYDQNDVLITEEFNEENNKRIWQAVADCYEDLTIEDEI